MGVRAVTSLCFGGQMCGKYDICESRTKGVYIGRKSKHVLAASSLDHSHPSTLLVVESWWAASCSGGGSCTRCRASECVRDDKMAKIVSGRSRVKYNELEIRR